MSISKVIDTLSIHGLPITPGALVGAWHALAKIYKPKKKGPASETGHEAPAGLPAKKTGSAWAKLISKIYEVDPLICPHCGSTLKIVAIITDSIEVKKILKCLMKVAMFIVPTMVRAC
jgi:hypothetical protein